MSVNKALILGRLGGDPELNYTGSGTAVCNMSVATDESYTREDGTEVDQTEWHDIVAWGRQAETCAEYLSKGSQVFVEGSLQTREWEDRDGNTRYWTEVKARRVQFLSGGGDGSSQRGSPQPQRQDPSAGPPKQREEQTNGQGGEQAFEPDDELPF